LVQDRPASNDRYRRIVSAKGDVVKSSWLVSKVVSRLFLWSIVVCLVCFASGLSFAVPWVRNFLNTSSANNILGILFAALVVLTIPCSLVVSFGMAIFCVFLDRSSIRVKVLWFLLFLFTWPVGSMTYFFTIYRGYAKRMGTLDVGPVGSER
jgi:hypothetical protein